MIYATAEFLAVRCEFAEDADANAVTAGLATTADGDVGDTPEDVAVYDRWRNPEEFVVMVRTTNPRRLKCHAPSPDYPKVYLANAVIR